MDLGCQYLARVPRALVTVSDFALVYKGEWLNDQVNNLFFHVIIMLLFQIINYALHYIFNDKLQANLSDKDVWMK